MFIICYFKQLFTTNKIYPDDTPMMIWPLLDYVTWQSRRNFVDAVQVANQLALSMNRKTVLGGPDLIR